jgi:hypothetical protein
MHQNAVSQARSMRRKKSTPAPIDNFNPFTKFFSEYPDFIYKPSQAPMDEYFRMCDQFGWDRLDRCHVEQVIAQADFKTAMVLQFNVRYGTDVSSLDSWHRLCIVLNITPLPDTVAECRVV